jgi:hypothetical protein
MIKKKGSKKVSKEVKKEVSKFLKGLKKVNLDKIFKELK